MIGRRRWISSMKRTSPSRWLVRIPTRSAGFSRIGPDVDLKLTPISRARGEARGGLPRPGVAGPGGAGEGFVSRRPPPPLGRLDGDGERVADLGLPDELRQPLGPKGWL